MRNLTGLLTVGVCNYHFLRIYVSILSNDFLSATDRSTAEKTGRIAFYLETDDRPRRAFEATDRCFIRCEISSPAWDGILAP